MAREEGRGLESEVQIPRLLLRLRRLFLLGLASPLPEILLFPAAFAIPLAGNPDRFAAIPGPVGRFFFASAPGFVAGPGLAPFGAIQFDFGLTAAVDRIARVPGMAAMAFEGELGLLHGFHLGVPGHSVERRDALAGGLLQMIGEPFRIVGDQIGPVASPATL